MAEKLLHWGDETLVISQGKILPTVEYSDTVTLPTQAKVIVKESIPNWGGHQGVTLFVEQTPPVHLDGYRRGRRYFGTDCASLFGRMSTIQPDGTYYPPQLPQVLGYVETTLGWEVNQRVKDLLASGRPHGS